MHTNRVFVRTAKAEREGMKLSNNLLRMLTLIDGKTPSSDLARRAPPSLRNIWHEHLTELVKGGYIVDNPADVIEYKNAQCMNPPIQKVLNTTVTHTSQKPQAATPAAADPEDKLKAEKAAKAAELKAYFATAKEKGKTEAEQAAQEDKLAQAKLKAAAAAAKSSSDAEAKAKAYARRKEEEALRAREKLEAASAAAKASSDAAARAKADLEAAKLASKVRADLGAKSRSNVEAKAKAEARQRDEKAAHARAELEAAVAASKTRSDALKKAKTEAKRREEEAARAHVELEAAKQAAKKISNSKAQSGTALNQDKATGIPDDISVSASRISPDKETRLHNLELENEALKKLLAEAYVEITALKTSR